MYLKSVEQDRHSHKKAPFYATEEGSEQKANRDKIERQRQALYSKLNYLKYGREQPAHFLDGRSVSTIREESAMSRTVAVGASSAVSRFPPVKVPVPRRKPAETSSAGVFRPAKPAVPRQQQQSQQEIGKYKFDTKKLSEEAKTREYADRINNKKKFDEYIRLGLQGIKKPQDRTKGEWMRLASGNRDVDRRALVDKIKLADQKVVVDIQRKKLEEKADKLRDEESGYLRSIKTKMELISRAIV